MRTSDKPADRIRIPGGINILLTLGAAGAALGLLWVCSHVSGWGWKLAAALLFSFVNNTLFSLLHESVHGMFHPNRAINDGFGRITAAFFPTGFTFQRVCHLGHHRRNRTELEMFDYLRPGEGRLLKYAQWYGILTGIYWLLAPLAGLFYLVAPSLFESLLRRGENMLALRQTGGVAMGSGFFGAPRARIRLELLFSLLFQVGMIAALNLTATGWLLCYAAFAVNWSSLQYADHAWSELDVRNGAWNLRVNRLVQYVFLNYHHHRAHHQHPEVPWLHLGRFVDWDEPRPSFLAIYLQMWKGPRPLPESAGDLPAVDRPPANATE